MSGQNLVENKDVSHRNNVELLQVKPAYKKAHTLTVCIPQSGSQLTVSALTHTHTIRVLEQDTHGIGFTKCA